MNDLPDKILIRNVKKLGCNESFLELCRRYENAFYKMCQKYTPALINSGVCPQDIYNEKNIIIYNCIKTFKASKKTKLSTWICNYARYLCLNSINARKFLMSVDNEDLKKIVENASSFSEFKNKENKDDDMKYIYNLLGQIKDKRILKIIQFRHLERDKKEWKYIAKKLNISAQTAINLHERGLNLIRKKIKSTEYSDTI
jgi:RNA polymerase sigma factor (sigma-70 family)